MPPTKPTLPVSDASAAAMPTRKDPSCSLKITDWTLGRSTTMSIRVNLVSGNSCATVSTAAAWAKPMATTTCAPLRAMLRSACSRMDGLVTSNSRYWMPESALKRSAPLKAASLNDLSNLPPMSKTTAGVKSSA